MIGVNRSIRTAGILAVCACLCLAILEVRSLVKAQHGVAQSEAEKTRQMLSGEIRSALTVIDARLASLERTADARLASIQATADGRLAGLQALADGHLAKITERADARLGEGIAEIGRLRADLKPVLASTDELLAQSSTTVSMLRPQLLGLTAASKVAAGHFAQMSIEGQKAFPRIIANVDHVTANSDRTTAATADVMTNLARATKPLPTWARVGLAIAPPMVSMGASVVTTLAITGKSK